MRLKELGDTLGATLAYDFNVVGADHALRFSATVEGRDASGVVRYHGDSGDFFPTKKQAQEAAAANALGNAGVAVGGGATLSAATRAQAWLGDAAFEFALALLGTREGLSVEQFDRLSQQLFNNGALAAAAPHARQLTSVVLTATNEEARLGTRLTPHFDSLLDILLPAVHDANPAVAAALQAAVAAA